MMSMAVGAATSLMSPVLVDDMLRFWEAGYNDEGNRLPRYPLLFAQERPDVIPRLKAIMENPATPQFVRFRIRDALDWYAKTLAAAQDQSPPIAEAPATPLPPRDGPP
jgi:hypothetical protein